MPKFRKKPVVIEARQLTMQNLRELKDWCGGEVRSRPDLRAVTGLWIPTLEGRMEAEFGCWIIKGVRGEFYPCRDDIFRETYEEAE